MGQLNHGLLQGRDAALPDWYRLDCVPQKPACEAHAVAPQNATGLGDSLVVGGIGYDDVMLEHDGS